MDFQSLLYSPLYEHFGVDATIRCLYSDAFTIRVIDQTSGVEVSDSGNLDIKTIRPAAVIRVPDLTALGLSRIDLEDAAIEIHEKLWIIKATMPKPSPAGEELGELYLFLIEEEE